MKERTVAAEIPAYDREAQNKPIIRVTLVSSVHNAKSTNGSLHLRVVDYLRHDNVLAILLAA